MAELPQIHLSLRNRQWVVDTSRMHDISIALVFDGEQPNFFDAPLASSRPLVAGSFVGDVREGGSCNCATYTITPHCNGTHTESVGHVTRDGVSIRRAPSPAFIVARLVTVAPRSAATTNESTDPAPQDHDTLITRDALQAACADGDFSGVTGLIVRTTPNPSLKRTERYGPAQPPSYFSAEAMRWIVATGIEHLVVDLPSIDRAEDAGRLTAHRLFWGLPPGATDAARAARPYATVTELAYIDDAIADGLFLLNLQTAPFDSDAAPSRPLLLPLLPR